MISMITDFEGKCILLKQSPQAKQTPKNAKLDFFSKPLGQGWGQILPYRLISKRPRNQHWFTNMLGNLKWRYWT